MKNYLIISLLAIILGFACESGKNVNTQEKIELPFYVDADYTPYWIKPTDKSYNYIHTIAPFSFINQNGDTITNETFENKIYVANFFFSICPGVCPKMTKNLHAVEKEFKENSNVSIISHSVMPWVDSVARLNEFARLNEIDADKWHLVTGPKEEIYKIARTSYFADEGFGKTITSMEDFLHTEKIMLIDQKRRIRGVYNGTLPMDISRMIDDIKSIL